MKSFNQFIREQADQFSYAGMTTRNFDICPSALEAFTMNAEEGEIEDTEEFIDAVKAVDRYLGFEKEIVDQGFATSDDADLMSDMVSRAIEQIAEAGLEGHDYHQIHLDAVEELVNDDDDDDDDTEEDDDD